MYTQELFSRKFNPFLPPPDPRDFSFELRSECQQIADVVYEASQVQGEIQNHTSL